MNKTIFGFLLAVVVVVTSVDIASGQVLNEPLFKRPLLFRKAKAYQRELLKQELKTELYSELGEKLDEDVAVAANEIREATEAQVAQESAKLQKQSAGHAQQLAQANKAFQTEFSAAANSFEEDLVASNAAFGKKLTESNKKERQQLVAAFRKANQELAVTNKVQAEAIAKLIAQLSTASEKSLRAMVTELGNNLAEANQAAVKSQIDDATKALVAHIDENLATAVASLAVQSNSNEPTPAPTPDPIPEEQSAAQAEPTVLKDDDSSDDDSSDDDSSDDDSSDDAQ